MFAIRRDFRVPCFRHGAEFFGHTLRLSGESKSKRGERGESETKKGHVLSPMVEGRKHGLVHLLKILIERGCAFGEVVGDAVDREAVALNIDLNLFAVMDAPFEQQPRQRIL